MLIVCCGAPRAVVVVEAVLVVGAGPGLTAFEQQAARFFHKVVPNRQLLHLPSPGRPISCTATAILQLRCGKWSPQATANAAAVMLQCPYNTNKHILIISKPPKQLIKWEAIPKMLCQPMLHWSTTGRAVHVTVDHEGVTVDWCNF